MKTSDVIIVGGGLAGLTAAAYLARADVAVTVFEKGATLGGRASTQNHNGYLFNRGIHALYTGGAASEVLQELSIPYTGGSPTRVHALRGGKWYVAPAGVGSLLSTTLLDWGDKLELMQLFMSFPRLNPADFQHISIRAWLDQNTKRPHVRQMFEAQARTFAYTTALDLVSADVFILKTQLAFKNAVVYLDGGWQTLVQGLRQAAEDAGAVIRSGVRVESIDVQAGVAQGVRLREGDLVPAQAVIVAAAPHDAAKLINHAPLQQIVDGLIPAQVASLDVALSRLPNDRYTVVQDMERALFMSIQSEHSKVAPAGGALVYSFKQLDPRQTSDPREDERDLENLLDAAQPGWRDVVVKRQFLPRIDAIGSLPTVSSGGYAGRPGTRVPGIDNLYLAGDWIGAGFLSDPSFASGREAAQQIVKAGVAARVVV